MSKLPNKAAELSANLTAKELSEKHNAAPLDNRKIVRQEHINGSTPRSKL